MKLAEISDKELFLKLVELEPRYYYESVGTTDQTNEYYKQLFKQINETIQPYCKLIKANQYHYNRKKNRIELYQSNKEYIYIYKQGGSITKDKTIDPEDKIKVINNDFKPVNEDDLPF